MIWLPFCRRRFQINFKFLYDNSCNLIQISLLFPPNSNQQSANIGSDKTGHYLYQWWPASPTHICATRPQWVNSSHKFNAIFINSYQPWWLRIYLFSIIILPTRPVTVTWWRHQMESFSAFLAVCQGNTPVTGGFPSQRPVTRSFDIFFDLRQNNRWFETPSRSVWRHCIGKPHIVM